MSTSETPPDYVHKKIYYCPEDPPEMVPLRGLDGVMGYPTGIQPLADLAEATTVPKAFVEVVVARPNVRVFVEDPSTGVLMQVCGPYGAFRRYGEWVLSKVALPSDGQMVLGWHTHHSSTSPLAGAPPHVVCCWWNSAIGEWSYGAFNYPNGDITHWMPMPQSPAFPDKQYNPVFDGRWIVQGSVRPPVGRDLLCWHRTQGLLKNCRWRESKNNYFMRDWAVGLPNELDPDDITHWTLAPLAPQ